MSSHFLQSPAIVPAIDWAPTIYKIIILQPPSGTYSQKFCRLFLTARVKYYVFLNYQTHLVMAFSYVVSFNKICGFMDTAKYSITIGIQ